MNGHTIDLSAVINKFNFGSQVPLYRLFFFFFLTNPKCRSKSQLHAHVEMGVYHNNNQTWHSTTLTCESDLAVV